MSITDQIKNIPESEKTPLVIILLEIIQQQAEEIQHLKDEIARLKGQKPKISNFTKTENYTLKTDHTEAHLLVTRILLFRILFSQTGIPDIVST